MKSKEEILGITHRHHDDEMGITWDSAKEAMELYASELQAENERLRKELEAIKERVPSNMELDDRSVADSFDSEAAQFFWPKGFRVGARWMRDRIFPPQNKTE